MNDPASLLPRHARLNEHSGAAWGLELILLLHGRRDPRQPPFQKRCDAFGSDYAPRLLDDLRGSGIETESVSYGADFARFESDLIVHRPGSFPLVSIPSSSRMDWAVSRLCIRPEFFIVGREDGHPVFLARVPRSSAVVRVELTQFRRWHEIWQRWPAVLPSMLLNVLWHRSAPETISVNSVPTDADSRAPRSAQVQSPARSF